MNDRSYLYELCPSCGHVNYAHVQTCTKRVLFLKFSNYCNCFQYQEEFWFLPAPTIYSRDEEITLDRDN